VALIRGARSFVLEGTGHLGTITRPAAFAAAVNEFVRSGDSTFAAESRRLHRTEVA
jgi:hypothetical protein